MFNLLAIDLQAAFASIETWVSAAIAFLVSTGAGGVVIGIIVKVLTNKVNTQTTASKKQLEDAAKTAAETAVKRMVGKSFNVNIKAEVDKAVKGELKPIRENAEYAAAAARNAEIASANVLLAQSRSRLLTKAEQATLQNVAQKILAHANGDVVTPTVIEFAEQPVSEAVEPTEKRKVSVSAENASLVSFADIK